MIRVGLVGAGPWAGMFTAPMLASADGVSRAALRGRRPAPAPALPRTDRLRAEAGEDFPEGVTAFRPEMKVHGRYGEPCPDCGTRVQRITYAEKNEVNYCPRCQTEGRLLADRSLSRLLREDWPRTIEELEEGRMR